MANNALEILTSISKGALISLISVPAQLQHTDIVIFVLQSADAHQWRESWAAWVATWTKSMASSWRCGGAGVNRPRLGETTTGLDIKGSGSAFEAQGPLEDQFIPIFSIKGLLVKMKSYLALMLPLALGVLSQQPLCPGGLYGNALCCDTDVLGVVDIDCTVRRWHPTSCSPLLRHS